jgi:hypothetical protein
LHDLQSKKALVHTSKTSKSVCKKKTSFKTPIFGFDLPVFAQTFIFFHFLKKLFRKRQIAPEPCRVERSVTRTLL